MNQLPIASTANKSDSGISSQRSSLLRSVGPDSLPALIELVEQITHAAHRADVDAERLELLAHAMNVDLDRVAADVVAEAEQMVDDLLLADDASLPRQQELRQRELARGHLDRLLIVEESPRRNVEAQPT